MPAVSLEQRVAELEREVAVLRAKQQIHEALMRYCRGVDRADADLIASAFHPDALSDHGLLVFEGNTIGAALASIERAVRTSMHMVGNELIELDGDTAYVEAYFVSYSEVDRDGEPYLISRGARYVDRWERRDGEWRIAYRVVPGEWNRVDAIVERIPNADSILATHHSREDAVYRIRERNWKLRESGGEDASRRFKDSLSTSGFSEAK